MLLNSPRVDTAKLESVEYCRTYVAAFGTALQLKVITSNGWKVEYPFGGPRLGAPPAPLIVKLRGCDHAPWTNWPLTACTRQKYVPSARPLTVSCVAPLVDD